LASDVHTPATAAVDALGIEYHTVTIGHVASAEEAAEARGIELSQLVKTLVVRESDDQYYFVLVPGNRAIDWPKLRAHVGVSRLSMPPADEAFSVTGYKRGTITPFGASMAWPVIMDNEVLANKEISIGSGSYGTAIHLSASECKAALSATVADISNRPRG